MGGDKNIALDGQAYALNVLTPISPGYEAELRDILAAIPAGGRSPFALVPGTHFARLVIIDKLAFEGRRTREPRLRLQYLLFSSVFDGPLDDYLRAICALIPGEAEEIWGACVGAPRPAVADDDDAFAAWIRHNQVHAGAFYAPYGHATLSRIDHSLELCRQLREFALSSQYLAPRKLKAAFDAEFPP